MNETIITAMQAILTLIIALMIAVSGGFIWFRVKGAIYGEAYANQWESAAFAAIMFVPFSALWILLWVVWNVF